MRSLLFRMCDEDQNSRSALLFIWLLRYITNAKHWSIYMTDFDDSLINTNEKILNNGITRQTAAAFDYFELKDVIRPAIGKIGSHVSIVRKYRLW